MKKTHFLFILSFFLFSACAENFKDINPAKFNTKIENRMDIKTPEALITVFYDYPANEGKPDISITAQKQDTSRYLITLINDNLEDDSVAGEKIVMEASLQNQIWKVTSIKKNWYCYKDRGHRNWGTSYCE